MSVQATLTWLKIASGFVICAGVLLASFALPISAEIIKVFADILIWPLDGTQKISAPETRLTLAISGGVLVGWGVLCWMISTNLFLREPHLVRKMLITSMSIWFVVDGTASMLAGAWPNVISNLSFLLLFVIPLWRVDLSGYENPAQK